ncbi:MAG TPA: PAS domain-containing protein, partial [Candidatus Nanopelagicales bacterium]|nr:PAS domain-containing protein [Candidatus Nanopelagicales bacterium]
MESTLQAFPEPVAIVGSNLRVQEVNAAWRAALPVDAAGALTPAVTTAVRAVLEGRLGRAEVDVDGYHWTAVPLPDMGAALLHARARSDVGGSAREQALAEENALFRMMIDAVPSMMFVKDRFGRFAMANQALAEAHGMTVDQVLQRSQREVHRNEDETESYLRVDQDVIRTGRVITLRET